MNDRVALGVFVIGLGVLLFLIPLFFGRVFLIFPIILVLIGIGVILNKEEDMIEERNDKKL